MKKIISLIMLFVMLVSVFVGCGSAASQVENKADQTSKKTINDILAESQAKNTTVAPKVDYPLNKPQFQHGLLYRLQHG